MTGDRPYRDWSASALAAELAAYEKHNDELSAVLSTTSERETRVALMTELASTNDVLDQLKAELSHRSIPPAASQTYRSVVVSDDHDPLRGDDRHPFAADPQQHFTQPSGHQNRRQPSQAERPARRFWQGVLIGILTLFAGGAAAYFLLSLERDSTEDAASGPATAEQVDSSTVDGIAAMVGALAPGVSVEQRGSSIFLGGTVESVEARQAVVGSAQALAGDVPIDSAGLVVSDPTVVTLDGGSDQGGGGNAFQSEIDRIIAATPIIFASGQIELTELHQRVLNNVAATMTAYPGIPVSVVGYTDDVGSDEANRQLSLARAGAVRDYLISKGVSETVLSVEAVGEEASTGSQQLANLERRVEFDVAASGPAGVEPLRVAIVAPSDQEDLAFTQSMVDAIDVIAGERGNLEVAITDNTFVPDEAAAAMRNYAEQGYDIIVAHGSQYGTLIVELAPEYPEVAFAWGTASETFGLSNVYAYDAAAEEGGYVLGALSALLSQTGTIGVVGPIEVGDAQRYINGFRAGAVNQSPGTSVRVTYTGSFSDTTFASDAANDHVAAGADVLTGSAQMVLGAVAVVLENELLWFGNQANQAALAPDRVGASQVYHWEVILRQIVADVDSGTTSGRSYTANLANGGLEIEYNPAVELPESARARADQLVTAIAAGEIVPLPG